MAISLDVLIGTLIFLVPGFIAVGVYVYMVRFFSRPDLGKGIFTLVALTLTLTLKPVFNSLVSHGGKRTIEQVSLPWQMPDYIAPGFLISLNALYGLADAAGGVARLMLNGAQALRRLRDGIAAQLGARVLE